MDVEIESGNLQFLNKYKVDDQTSKPTSKDVNPLDFKLNDALPPNTGPPGTVPVTNNGSNSNKNLSHVPCKFFKQGVCQAGSSCPFSHNFDGSLGADKLPCKYFQKGNCKFGLKCALGHYLPDGTRINSRNYTYHGRKSNSKSSNFGSLPIEIGFNQMTPPNKPASKFMNLNGSTPNASSNGADNDYSNLTYMAIDITQNTVPSTKSSRSSSHGNIFNGSNGNSGLKIFGNGQQINVLNGANLTVSAGEINGFQRTSSFGNGSFMRLPSSDTSPVGLSNSSSSPQHSSFFHKGNVASNSPTNNLSAQISRSFSSNMPNSHSSFSSFAANFNESAIADDENEDSNYNDFHGEDFIPASLGDDILTPQEKQRRGSRSQSGTLLVRPIFKNKEKSFNDGDTDDVFLME